MPEKKKLTTKIRERVSKKEEKKELALFQDPWQIILYPLLTEKVIGKVESENKLVFIVRRDSRKKQIKWAVEKLFDVKVADVGTLIDQKGRKKAFVRLTKEFSATDIATRMGMI